MSPLRISGLAVLAAVAIAMLGPGTRNALADEKPRETTADPDAWRFRATAYGWLMSVSGNMTARGQTVDVDASFIQLVQKSDSLIGFMGYFEANKGPVGFYTDFVWARLGFDHSTASYRNPIAGLQISTTTNTALTYSLTIVEAGGLYEFARWPGSPGSFTAIDGVLGFRYWNNSIDANFDFIGSVDFSRLGIERGRSFAIARSGNLDWVAPPDRASLAPSVHAQPGSDGARRCRRFRPAEPVRMAGGRRLQLRLAVHRLSAGRRDRLPRPWRQLRQRLGHQHQRRQPGAARPDRRFQRAILTLDPTSIGDLSPKEREANKPMSQGKSVVIWLAYAKSLCAPGVRFRGSILTGGLTNERYEFPF